MLYRFLIIGILTSFAFQPVLHAEEKTAYVICKNQKQVRTLGVRPATDGKNCETVYTKEGIPKVQGSGKNFEGCMKILGNIRKNLEKSWWKCKDVTDAAQIIR